LRVGDDKTTNEGHESNLTKNSTPKPNDNNGVDSKNKTKRERIMTRTSINQDRPCLKPTRLEVGKGFVEQMACLRGEWNYRKGNIEETQPTNGWEKKIEKQPWET